MNLNLKKKISSKGLKMQLEKSSHTYTHNLLGSNESALFIYNVNVHLPVQQKGNVWDYPVCFASSNTLQVYRKSADLHLQNSSEPTFLKVP